MLVRVRPQGKLTVITTVAVASGQALVPVYIGAVVHSEKMRIGARSALRKRDVIAVVGKAKAP